MTAFRSSTRSRELPEPSHIPRQLGELGFGNRQCLKDRYAGGAWPSSGRPWSSRQQNAPISFDHKNGAPGFSTPRWQSRAIQGGDPSAQFGPAPTGTVGLLIVRCTSFFRGLNLKAAPLKIVGGHHVDTTVRKAKDHLSVAHHNALISRGNLERAKGFEPSTPTLARLCSTPELRPRSKLAWYAGFLLIASCAFGDGGSTRSVRFSAGGHRRQHRRPARGRPPSAVSTSNPSRPTLPRPAGGDRGCRDRPHATIHARPAADRGL